MRTTVTLESDVDQLLRAAMVRGRKSFKQTLNEAVRRGLKGEAGDPEAEFVVETRPMVLRPGIDPARLRELDDDLEIEEFRRKTSALKVRAQEARDA